MKLSAFLGLAGAIGILALTAMARLARLLAEGPAPDRDVEAS